jgi:predicted dehydrogenase
MVEELPGNMKNILIIGLGSIGQRHLRNLSNIGKNFNFFAYRRKFKTPTLNFNNLVTKQEIKKKYKIHYLSSLRNLKKNNIDTAFICSPSSFHIRESINLLKQNINIFVEKPIGSSLKDVQLLKKILKKTKSISMMGFQMKFCPIINKIKYFVKKKMYGEPKYISIHHGEHIKNFHKYENYEKLYAAKKNLGGGVVLTQIHEIDYLLYIFSEFKINKTKSFSKKISNLKMNVEDTLAASILLKNKKKILLCNLSLNYYEISRKREINIIFENASIKADLINQKIIIDTGIKKKIMSLPYERNDLFKNEIFFFRKHIIKNKKIPREFSLENGIKSLELALKLKNL